jgi:Flp pilus assembly protein TadG
MGDSQMARVADFLNNTRGTTAMLWAVMILPILVIAGGAIDFSRHATASKQLRAATDAAAIATLRTYLDTGMDKPASEAAGLSIFQEDIKVLSGSAGVAPVITIDPATGVTVTATFNSPTTMLAIIGISSLTVKAKSRVAVSSEAKLEAALVLDMSGSMSGTRVADLRDAAEAFLDTVLTDSTGRVKIAVVPFNNEVNIGVSHAGAPWLDVQPSWSESYESCEIDFDASVALGCSSSIVSCTSTYDGVTSSGMCEQWSCPAGVSFVIKNCSTINANYEWQGCVRSRPYPLDVEDASYDSDKIVGFVAPASGCPSPILPLTADRAKLDAHIAALNTSSDTYIAPALAWGMRVLSSKAPFSEGADEVTFAGEGGRKVLILMSDGENTRSRSTDGDHYKDGAHNGSDTDEANDRTVAACNAAKAAGIEVYTIAFNVDDPDTLDILSGCASSIDNFYDVTDGTELVAAFTSVGVGTAQIALVE